MHLQIELRFSMIALVIKQICGRGRRDMISAGNGRKRLIVILQILKHLLDCDGFGMPTFILCQELNTLLFPRIAVSERLSIQI